jgi:hypothetical protein
LTLAFEAAVEADTINAIDAFLAANPGSRFQSHAASYRRELLAREEAFRVAKAVRDTAKLKEFLDKYPTGAPAREIRAQLRILELPRRLTGFGIVAGCIIAFILWEIIGLWDTAGPSPSVSHPMLTLPPSDSLVAQKVVLYEEDMNNPMGIQYGGAAVWSTKQMSSGPGQKLETVIRAEIEIPEQKLSLRLSLRRNDDKQLPASHTVEVVFTRQPGFSHGGIADVPGIMMKQGETTRGSALRGVRIKVTESYFLVGLSSTKDADVQYNVQLLKERPWFDIPVVFADGKRALIAVEKGMPGERAFSEAFAAWEQ